MIKNIKFIPKSGEEIILKVHKGYNPYTVEEILSTKAKVYEDLSYEMALVSDEEIERASIYLNGEKLETLISADKVQFKTDSWQKGIFSGQFGFGQITVCVTEPNGAETWYYSEFTSILVRSTEQNRSIDAMLKYIYENQDEILKNTASTVNTGNDLEKTYDDFWSQILLLEDIANVYETSYGYFKANSRTQLKMVEVVDQVEKLQYIDAKTVYYMTQHPDLLKREVTGIRYGKDTFLPNKTLMLRNQVTQDIDENRIVLSFLDRLIKDVMNLKGKIAEFLNLLIFDEYEENGYFNSSYLLYRNAKDTLNVYKNRVEMVTDKLGYLFKLYQQILPVKIIDLTVQPSPSTVFMSVPQYNRIYNCLLKWYGKVGYDFSKEQVMLNFFNVPSIYQAYVLVKLVNQIKAWGFILVEKPKNVSYPKKTMWRYQNKEYANTFVFEKGEQQLILYYEPIIYDTDHKEVNQISIYRNNTVSIPSESDKEYRGHYYVPDYLIKAVVDGKERYVICDAKYSRINKVRTKLIPELAYKYLFSISPVEENVSIEGMNIFYGITEENVKAESFYDRAMGARIKPFTELIPLSEKVSLENQEANALQLLQHLLKR